MNGFFLCFSLLADNLSLDGPTSLWAGVKVAVQLSIAPACMSITYSENLYLHNLTGALNSTGQLVDIV